MTRKSLRESGSTKWHSACKRVFRNSMTSPTNRNRPLNSTGRTPDVPAAMRPTASSLEDSPREESVLDETLVIWGGEFGRGVAGQGKWDSPEAGRDHHPRCFTIWMAGGGIKPGITFGATDDFSYNVAENPVHVRDLHATALHLLGIDHERFSYRFQGLDYKLTGVDSSRVVKEILT